MTLIAPPPGGLTCISRSRPAGGQITPWIVRACHSTARYCLIGGARGTFALIRYAVAPGRLRQHGTRRSDTHESCDNDMKGKAFPHWQAQLSTSRRFQKFPSEVACRTSVE
jgi:hypothetical protein